MRRVAFLSHSYGTLPKSKKSRSLTSAGKLASDADSFQRNSPLAAPRTQFAAHILTPPSLRPNFILTESGSRAFLPTISAMEGKHAD